MQSLHLNASWFQAFLRISTLKCHPKKDGVLFQSPFFRCYVGFGAVWVSAILPGASTNCMFYPKCHPPKERTSIFYTWCLHIIWMYIYIYVHTYNYMCITYTCVLISLKTSWPIPHPSKGPWCFLQFSSCLTCIVPHVWTPPKVTFPQRVTGYRSELDYRRHPKTCFLGTIGWFRWW